jgi:hypothetical protein
MGLLQSYITLLLVINKIMLPGLDPMLGSVGFLVDKVRVDRNL